MKIPDKQTLEDSLKFHINGDITVEVIKPLVYEFGRMVITIPVSSNRYDGASLPFFLKAFWSGYNIHIIAAAILHDYIHSTQFVDRFVADAFFRMVLSRTANKVIAWFLWLGVRIGGWYAWNKSKKKLDLQK